MGFRRVVGKKKILPASCSSNKKNPPIRTENGIEICLIALTAATFAPILKEYSINK